MKKAPFIIAFVLSGYAAFCQQDDSLFIRKIADEILVNSQAYNNLHELTKKIGGRLSGSPQMVKAEKWGAAALKSAGADKIWLQECMVPHWVRGGKDILQVKQPSKTIQALALGNSIGTGIHGITAPVILIDSFAELESKKELIKGKIVFYNYKFNPKFINTGLAYSDAVPYRYSGASKAAAYGAVAVVIRSMTHSTDNFAHTGTLHYDSGSVSIPAVAIGLKDADWLAEKLTSAKLSVYLKTNARILPDTTGHNIIGELTGSDFPDQFITVGGHLDSWDPAEGAHDDGTGVVQTIELLRAFKAMGFQPKHTIRFVLFANEENGTRGGNKYAEQANQKNEKHIFAMESDAGGFTPRGFIINSNDSQYALIGKWSSLFLPYGGGLTERGEEGADIAPLFETLHTPMAGLNPDSQRYFDYHHSASDVFENVNKRELELGAINMAALIYLVDKYGLDATGK